MEEKGGAGADADADADVNADAFLQAVSDGEHEEVEAMLRVRPLELVNWRVPVSGYSPLHLAARFGAPAGVPATG
ncbi:hypothetical protein DIPPA_05291 [Diplonema papillatum]|nr:hypothetical protein DIPPA_05291 [Diplonema papillatum]